jgi:predicted RNA-binding Zn-ribbon protein involved in translation (DUF1610 family)
MNYKSFNLGDWIGHISGVIEDETTLDGNEMRDLVEFLSTLKQEPQIGHWIKYGISRCEEQHYKCTSCGYYINFGQWGEFYTKEFKYCPNCGRRMIKPQAESEV